MMPALEVPRLTIRPARVGDVPGIYEQILVFAEQKLMIRRSMAELYESIREFIVAVDDENRVVGCVALHVFWEDLAEIRGLAVAEHVQGMGVGRRLVDACWESARELEIKSVFALTNAVGFFERCGYHRIDKSELPQRIWNECVRCPSFPNCQEIALIRSTEPEPARRPVCRTWRPPRSDLGRSDRRESGFAQRNHHQIIGLRCGHAESAGRALLVGLGVSLATAVLMLATEPQHGHRLGRGIHPRPRGAAARLVPRAARSRSVRGPMASAAPRPGAGPGRGQDAAARRATSSIRGRSCSSTPTSWSGSGRSRGKSRTAIRRSMPCSAWPATSWPRPGRTCRAPGWDRSCCSASRRA